MFQHHRWPSYFLQLCPRIFGFHLPVAVSNKTAGQQILSSNHCHCLRGIELASFWRVPQLNKMYSLTPVYTSKCALPALVSIISLVVFLVWWEVRGEEVTRGQQSSIAVVIKLTLLQRKFPFHCQWYLIFYFFIPSV